MHKFHKVVGRSAIVEVRGSVDERGLKVMARAPARSFDSGNSNRDEHVMESVDAVKYPWVTVRAARAGFTLPANASTTRVLVDATVELHGVAVSHPITLTLTAKDGTHFHVSFEFTEKMTDHKITRPTLFFIPVDDDMTITGNADVVAKR